MWIIPMGSISNVLFKLMNACIFPFKNLICLSYNGNFLMFIRTFLTLGLLKLKKLNE